MRLWILSNRHFLYVQKCLNICSIDWYNGILIVPVSVCRSLYNTNHPECSSPLTASAPVPILDQTWVSRGADVPTQPPVMPAVAPSRDYTALTVSHSAPASHQASFERGESVERTTTTTTRPLFSNTTNNNNRYAQKYCQKFYFVIDQSKSPSG